MVFRAVFVPEGEQPPPEFASFDQLRFPATRDPVTGEITRDQTGTSFEGDIRAEWHPDEEADQFGNDAEDQSDGDPETDSGDNIGEEAS